MAQPPVASAAAVTQVGNWAVTAAVRSDGILSSYWRTGDSSASWYPEEVPDSEGPFQPVISSPLSVAQVGSSAVIAIVSLGGSLWFYWHWQTGGPATPWNPESVSSSVPNPARIASAPSVAQVGNMAAIAAQATDGSLWFYWKTIDTVPWHQEPVPSQVRIASSPSLAQVGNMAVIAARGIDGRLWFYWRQMVGSKPSWQSKQVAGSHSIASAPSVAQVGNMPIIAAQGTDGSLLFYWWQAVDSKAHWQSKQVAGSHSTASSPSVAQFGNKAAIAVQRSDNSLWFYGEMGSFGASWYPWAVTGGNAAYLAPSLAHVGNPAVIVAGGNGLWSYWYRLGTQASWQPTLVTTS